MSDDAPEPQDWIVPTCDDNPLGLDLNSSPTFQEIASEEDDNLNKRLKQAKIEEEVKKLEHVQELREYRKKYVQTSFIIVIVWLVSIHIMLILLGTALIELDTIIVTTYLASTTISVLGLMGISLHWLFPRDKG